MLPDVQHLMELQQADREILRLNQEVAALPKRVAAIEEKLAGTKAGLEKAKAAVKADEATKRKYESAIQDLQGKISKYRDQSLAVKTNEQYKALLHEIEFAEQEIKSNEDKILELMLNADARDKDVKAAEIELKAEMAEIEKEKAAARERTAEDEKLLAEWNAKRNQARAGVNEDLLRQYERVSKFRGSGLAEVRDQKCMGCQVMLRPQTYNEVRNGQIIVCESCQRVLYFDPATGVAVVTSVVEGASVLVVGDGAVEEVVVRGDAPEWSSSPETTDVAATTSPTPKTTTAATAAAIRRRRRCRRARRMSGRFEGAGLDTTRTVARRWQ